jgi:type IV pilus assembly protein PilQ
MLVAFGAISGRPAVLSAVLTPNDATVTSLSVVPATGAGHADVVIRVDGTISYKHFILSKPDKIVVDISGATLGLPQVDAYDGVARGGITRIRYSQFTKSVVRVVLTLDAPHDYTVSQNDGALHVSVDGAGAKFSPWQVNGSGAKAEAKVAKADATKADAAKAEPAKTEPAKTEPAKTEPVKTESAKAEPAKTEPAKTEPAKAEAAKTESAKVEAEEPTSPAASATAKSAKQQSQEPRITVNWEGASISDVLGVFSTFTGRTILQSKSVGGTVTANIMNLPWDVALKEVMNANGYDVTVNPDGVIFIDTFENISARQATVPLQTRNVRLNYARANAAAPMVRERLTRTCPQMPMAAAGIVNPSAPGAPAAQPLPQVGIVQSINCPVRGAVTADTITNSISITDIPTALSDLERYARSLDLRQPQVNIKAKIILVDRTSLEGLGLRYDLGSPQQFFNDIVPRLDSLGKPRTDAGQILLGGNTVSAIANATQRIPAAALQLVYSTAMGNFDFTTFLEALQQTTLLDVQAEPSASVLNNRTANLTAGTQVPIRVIDAGAGGNQTSNFPRAAVSFQQTGVILTVTPQITANRQIQMKVHVENSDVQFQANDVGAVFPTQKVDNEVLVADGETAVMGGLTQTTLSVTKSGLPVLVDLPIIGRLFGVTTRQEIKRDLLILITPHIIDDGQQASPAPPETGRP